jgi:hypothetical protein
MPLAALRLWPYVVVESGRLIALIAAPTLPRPDSVFMLKI